MLKLPSANRSNFPGDEQSQRSRSFLFASTAALVAMAIGFEDVYVNENGIMAVHVPLTAARLGSFSTRTATPRVLDQMARSPPMRWGRGSRSKTSCWGRPRVTSRSARS